MKNAILLLLLLSLYSACKDPAFKCTKDTLYRVEAEGNVDDFFGIGGYGSGRIDDTINGGTITVDYKKNFRFDQFGGPNCKLTRQISVVNIPFAIGDTTLLVSRESGFEGEVTEAIYFITDDDAIVAIYDLLSPETFPSWFLLECDEEEGEAISGQFQFGFTVRDGFSSQNVASYNLPDTLLLRYGVFNARSFR